MIIQNDDGSYNVHLNDKKCKVNIIYEHGDYFPSEGDLKPFKGQEKADIIELACNTLERYLKNC